jgi:hypothetical protein
VDTAKVVVAEKQGEHVLVVFNFFGEGIRQAGEAAIAHADRQVMALNEAG